MNRDRAVRAFVGLIVLAGAILSVTVNPWWIALSIFVGTNMLPACVMGFCPSAIGFKPFGMRPARRSAERPQ